MAKSKLEAIIESLKSDIRSLADPSKGRGLKKSGKMIKENVEEKLKPKPKK